MGSILQNMRLLILCVHGRAEVRPSSLDPAVGNSVFLKYARTHNASCSLTGFEIDREILDYFGNPAGADIINDDYLLRDWEKKYDAIICNPPYSRFQVVENRNEVLKVIYEHTERNIVDIQTFILFFC
ncbi:MAG: hypothetical protein ACLUFI_09225 [Oscillospiraceae bacterium]